MNDPYLDELKRKAEKKRAETNRKLLELKQLYRLGVKEKSLERLRQLENSPDSSGYLFMVKLEFQEIVRKHIAKSNAQMVDKSFILNKSARLLGKSPATTKRYLGEMVVEGGPFVLMDSMVMLSTNFTLPEDDDYWDEPDDDDPLPDFLTGRGNLHQFYREHVDASTGSASKGEMDA